MLRLWSVMAAFRTSWRGNGLENQAGSDKMYEFCSLMADVNAPVDKHWLAWTASFETASVRPRYIEMPNTTGHWYALQSPLLLATRLKQQTYPARSHPRHLKVVVAVCADTCGRLLQLLKQ